MCYAWGRLPSVMTSKVRKLTPGPAGTRYTLTTANVDALDPAISWGTHVNVSLERDLWASLLEDPRYPSVLGFVASAIGAAIAFFGAGYVASRRSWKGTQSRMSARPAPMRPR